MPTPYLSVSELVNAPTGINWANIPVKQATAQQQLDEQVILIHEATSWVDTRLQYGFDPVVGYMLSATQQTETEALVGSGGRRCRFMPDGTFVIFTRYLPVICTPAIQPSLQYSSDGVTWGSLANFVALQKGPQSFRVVPPQSGNISLQNVWSWPPYGGWLQFTYLAGFGNSALTGVAKIAAGATSLPLADLTGFQAGQLVNIFDGPTADEVVQVAAGYVSATGPGNLPLATGTQYDHTPPTAPNWIAVSAMPTTARLATRILVKEIVRQRGYEAIALTPQGRGRTSAKQESISGSSPDQQADMLLQPLKRVL